VGSLQERSCHTLARVVTAALMATPKLSKRGVLCGKLTHYDRPSCLEKWIKMCEEWIYIVQVEYLSASRNSTRANPA